MYIIDVIPLVKIPKSASQVLSYFSSKNIKIGAIVSAPLGRASINALVVSSYEVDDQKISIKKSGFQMKNIKSVISEDPALSEKQLELFKWFVKFYFSPIGLAAKAFIPSYLAKRKTATKYSLKGHSPEGPTFSNSLQRTDLRKKELVMGTDRVGYYRQKMKEALDKNRQVLFLVPDMYALDFYAGEFADFHPALISSRLSPKKHFEVWADIKNNKAKLIISTRMGVFLNFADPGLIILDEEQDSAYKSQDMMPYYHTKDVAFKLSEIFNTDLILGSATPDISTYYLANLGAKQLSKNLQLVNLEMQSSNKRFEVIDMRNEIHGGNYSILSYRLQQELENIIQDNKQAILFISRRGAETFVFCRDCGYVEKCPKCDNSLIHHKDFPPRGRSSGILVCHYCGFKKDPLLACPTCKSHRIKYFGAGTQKAKEEILKNYPEAKVEILDIDSAPTIESQKNIIQKFKNKEINLLIGTQLLLRKHGALKADLVCILSIDNILYIPDFKSGERIFRIMRELSFLGKNKAKFLLQTYTPEHGIFEIIKDLDYEKFYKQEIESREAFGYPPFSKLVKLIFKDKNKDFAEKEVKKMAAKISSLKLTAIHVLGPAPAYIPKMKNEYIWHIILKIENNEKGEEEKNAVLKNIPEGWTIDVNPESML